MDIIKTSIINLFFELVRNKNFDYSSLFKKTFLFSFFAVIFNFLRYAETNFLLAKTKYKLKATS